MKEREIKNERDNNKERKLMHESEEENWRNRERETHTHTDRKLERQIDL